jgi:hypothetical protein
MSTYNNPQPENTAGFTAAPKKTDYRNLVYILLTGGLLGSLGYIWWDKTQQKEKEKEQQAITLADNAKDGRMEAEYNAALIRLDSISADNTSKDAKISSLEDQIKATKREINSLMGIKNKSEKEKSALRAEINKLNGLISERNNRILELEAQNKQLGEENQIVKTERDQVRSELEISRTDHDKTRGEKKVLEDQVDVGSTLSAYNFNITGVNEKKKGREKTTSTAKRVDKLRISFDLDANRITTSGKKQLYVLVTGPDGNPVTVEALGSGKFTTREEGEKFYTSMMDVDYMQGEKKPVSFDWRQDDFLKGDYKVEVYQNGFKIGQGKVTFKKGGLFS